MRKRWGRTEETCNAANATITIELTKITSFDGSLSVRPDHLPQKVEFAVMMINAASKDNRRPRQTHLEVGDMPDQRFPTHDTRGRVLINSIVAPGYLQEATALRFVGL